MHTLKLDPAPTATPRPPTKDSRFKIQEGLLTTAKVYQSRALFRRYCSQEVLQGPTCEDEDPAAHVKVPGTSGVGRQKKSDRNFVGVARFARSFPLTRGTRVPEDCKEHLLAVWQRLKQYQQRHPCSIKDIIGKF